MKKNSIYAYFFHIAFISFIMMPLVAVLLMSFTSQGYLAFSPLSKLSIRWYHELFQNDIYMQAFKVSIKLGILASTAACIIAVPASLAIAKHDFYGKNFINSFLLSPLMIPNIILGIALLRFFSIIGITKSFTGLFIAHTLFVSPYAMRLVLAVAYSLDKALDNAASSLGASKFRIILKITLPLLIPGIISGWLISFIQSFDEVTMSLFLTPSSAVTLPVQMYTDIDENLSPLITAVSGVAIFGAFALMIIIDRFFGLEKVLIGSEK